LHDTLAAPGHRLCLFVDEYELLFEDGGGRGPIEGVAELFRMLRGIAQTTERLSVTFIGRDPRHIEKPLLEGVSNPLLGMCSERWLGPLGQAPMKTMLEELGRRVDLTFGESSLDAIWRATGGHPSLARQLGSAFLRLARRRGVWDTADARLPFEDALDELLTMSYPRQMLVEMVALLEQRYDGSLELLASLASARGEAMTLDTETWRSDAMLPLRRLGLVMGERRQAWLPELVAQQVRLAETDARVRLWEAS